MTEVAEDRPKEATDASPTVVRLDVSVSPEIKGILYQAYRNEATFKYLFDGERAGYDQRVRATLRELIALHFSQAHDAIGVMLGDRLAAVALIGPPELRLNLTDQINWRLRMMLTAGLASTRRYIDYHNQIKACLPEAQHHELPLMGVHPKHQNRGMGRVLLEAVEAVCAESPRTCGIGLDTGNSRYLGFYESLGYRAVGTVKLGGVTEHVMFKALAPAAV